MEKIGCKIGKVIEVDDTTANVERDQYTRLSVEVDLTKPLLSKFRLNGRIWRIQYEGLRMICLACGKQGHKEESCPLAHHDKVPGNPVEHNEQDAASQVALNTANLDDDHLYGS